MILAYKYQKQIENFLLRIFRSKKKEYSIDKEEVLKNNELKNRTKGQSFVESKSETQETELNEFKENKKKKAEK